MKSLFFPSLNGWERSKPLAWPELIALVKKELRQKALPSRKRGDTQQHTVHISNPRGTKSMQRCKKINSELHFQTSKMHQMIV